MWPSGLRIRSIDTIHTISNVILERDRFHRLDLPKKAFPRNDNVNAELHLPQLIESSLESLARQNMRNLEPREDGDLLFRQGTRVCRRNNFPGVIVNLANGYFLRFRPWYSRYGKALSNRQQFFDYVLLARGKKVKHVRVGSTWRN